MNCSSPRSRRLRECGCVRECFGNATECQNCSTSEHRRAGSRHSEEAGESGWWRCRNIRDNQDLRSQERATAVVLPKAHVSAAPGMLMNPESSESASPSGRLPDVHESRTFGNAAVSRPLNKVFSGREGVALRPERRLSFGRREKILSPSRNRAAGLLLRAVAA